MARPRPHGRARRHGAVLRLPDVDATFHHLLPFGVTVLEKPVVTVYNMKRFAIADPDDYNLCFQGPVKAQ